MTDRELLELIASQVGGLTNRVDALTTQMSGLTNDMTVVKTTMATKDELASVEATVTSVKATVIRIENDHGQKLGALFDGYKLNSEKLDRIEAEVTRHEEIILRKIR